MGLTGQKIYKYDLQGNFITEYPSQQAASDIDNVPFSYITDHIRGKFSFCKGHIYTKKYYIKLPNELLVHKSKRIYKTKEVHQYDLKGNYLKSYGSRKEASKVANVEIKTLSDYLSHSNRAKSVGGFLWSYEKKENLDEYKKNMQYKPIHQYSKNGEYIKTFNSLKEAASELNILSSSISHCARGNKKFPSYGGFIWRYEKVKNVQKIIPRIKRIKVYKDNKLFKIYENQVEVKKELKMSQTMIWKCLSGQKESFNGYVLKYEYNV